MEAVHHFELPSQLFLSEVVQHACIHQRLHEVAPVLRQTQTGQPVIPNPLVVHITVGQNLTHTHTYTHIKNPDKNFHINSLPGKKIKNYTYRTKKAIQNVMIMLIYASIA